MSAVQPNLRRAHTVSLKRNSKREKLGAVAQSLVPSAQEAEAGRSSDLAVGGQLGHPRDREA